MNYVTHINLVLSEFNKDSRIRPFHISLYMAIFRQWNRRKFPKYFSLRRKYIMPGAKISSKSTYHRTLRELHEWGYLKYFPSHSTNPGSQVSMVRFPKIGVPGSSLEGQGYPTGGQHSIYIKHNTIKTILDSRKEEFKKAFENENLDDDQQSYFMDWLDSESRIMLLKRLKAHELILYWLEEYGLKESSVSQQEDYLRVKNKKRYDQPL